MEISLKRLKKDIEILGSFNETPGNGCTRFSYSCEDAKAKTYLMQEMKSLGLEIKVDGIGNIRGRLKGTDPNLPPIMIGSHIDTVKHGGMFDGVVGVTGGLEVIRVLKENNVDLNHPVELIIFAEEEGSNFGSATLGSKALVGKLNLGEIRKLKNNKEKSCYDVLKEVGLNPDDIEKITLKPQDVKAMLELHIEQSIVLDKNNLSIGIVKGISGIRAYTIELIGESNHAGATPMRMRKDPLVAAAKLISSISQIVKEKGLETTVATVGKIECYPNVINVIPQRVKFTVDIRDVDNEAMDRVLCDVKQFVENTAYKNGLICKIERLGESKGILLCQKIVDIIEEITREKNLSYCKMNSGAVHDAALMAGITDVGMIFVPSKEGRSHCPEEYTSFDDIKRGCDVLLETVIKIDKL